MTLRNAMCRTGAVWIAVAALLLSPARTPAARLAAASLSAEESLLAPQDARDKEQERRDREQEARDREQEKRDREQEARDRAQEKADRLEESCTRTAERHSMKTATTKRRRNSINSPG